MTHCVIYAVHSVGVPLEKSCVLTRGTICSRAGQFSVTAGGQLPQYNEIMAIYDRFDHVCCSHEIVVEGGDLSQYLKPPLVVWFRIQRILMQLMES